MSHDNGNLAEEQTRVKTSAAEKSSAVKKKPVSEENTVKKKASEEERQTVKKKASDGEQQAVRRRPSDEEPQTVKKKASDEEIRTAKKPAGRSQTGAKKKPVKRKKKPVKRRPVDGRRREPAGRRASGREEDFETHMTQRDKERARRRAARLRRVRRQKIMMAVSAVVIVAAVTVLVVFGMPSMRLSRSLTKGDKCVARAEYAQAQEAYEKALEIDALSVHAYRGLAANYLAQEQTQEAKQIVYTGWEQTQDKSLLDYYCTVVYNEAVTEVNQKNCTLATVDKCLQILEQEPDYEDAWKLLTTCYERLFKVTEDNTTCQLFYDEDATQDTCSYTEYELLLRRLMALYQANPSGQGKSVLAQYAAIDMPYVRISLAHVPQYAALLTEINAMTGDARLTETLACLSRAQEVTDYFATAFTEFENGNYAYARDLVAQESYQQLRDSFINENSGYWEGMTYIPVNRELLVLHNENGQVKFYFPDSGEYENKQGILFVWGSKQEDDGVQRSAISYEPVEDEASGSHTVYKVQYLYSNVKIGNQYEPQMNYRFDTEITTAEGTTTNAIGDWGGEHEWELDY